MLFAFRDLDSSFELCYDTLLFFVRTELRAAIVWHEFMEMSCSPFCIVCQCIG